MAYKRLLALLDHRAHAQARAAYCAKLARALGARLEGLALVPPLEVPQKLRSREPAIDLLKKELAGSMDDMRAVAEAFAATARAEGAVSAKAAAVEGDPLGELEARAKFFDLIVLGQPDSDDMGMFGGHFVEEVILGTGRPVLVLPLEPNAPVPPREALVAWNDGRECWRAMAGALPLLAASAKVVLVTVAEEGREVKDTEEAISYLADQGIPATAEVLRGDDVARALLGRSARADLMVMGAFGRSRLSEMVLGGATHDVLAGMRSPVLLAH